MFYSDTVSDTRELFFTSWENYQKNTTLTPLEQQIVAVILAHPEYHKIVDSKNKFLNQTFHPELGQTNPFLHMGLHLAIREQVATNRPFGIQAIYNQLVKHYADPLEVEHLMMDQLAELLWLAQKNNTPPDEQLYLEGCSKIGNKHEE